MTEKERTGAAVALADLVKAGIKKEHETPPEEQEQEPRNLPAKAPGRRARTSPPPPPAAGGWAGAVPKTKIQREQLNAGLPMELDLMRRLRRYSADSGVDVQDLVAAVLHDALTDLGY